MIASLISDVILVLAACAYAAATVGFAVHLARRGGSEGATRIARWVMAAGVGLHAVHIVYHGVAQHVCPMKTINMGISLGALVAALAYLVARRALKIYGLGVFVAPIALIFLLAGRFIGWNEIPSALGSSLLPLHVAVNVLGDGFFLLASSAAAMYLFQERQLKAKRGAAVFGRLPPLDSLDRAAFSFLLIGFLLMTVGVVTGTFWVSRLSARIFFGYLTWTVFSAVLLLRSTLGWRGKRAAYGTLAGFACAAVVLLLYLLEAEA